jgi:nicotinamide-nucleotide amidase
VIKAEILAIGDELLIGQVNNTNAQWLSQELTVRGIQVVKHQSISDHESSIKTALDQIATDTTYVFITGGLGPTKDDITKHVLVDYFNDRLVLNEERLQRLKEHYVFRGRTLNELNKTQAMLPETALTLDNAVGTACGMWFKRDSINVISMPGVPFEMKHLMNTHVFPLLEEDSSVGSYMTIRTVGIPESDLAIKLESWENNLGNDYKLAYLPNLGQVRLRLTSFHKEDNETVLMTKLEELKALIPEFIFGYNDTSLAESIGQLLVEKSSTISTAESCTGGSIARSLTSFGGSSAFFKGSIVAYDNEIKTSFLDVRQEDLNQFGAVSQQVVEQMAAGVRKKFDTDYAVSTTGIAGPDGGTPDKPVGTVWIAVAGPEGVVSRKLQLGQSRSLNIDVTVVNALDLLRREFSTNH